MKFPRLTTIVTSTLLATAGSGAFAQAQGKLKVGMMLPSSGTFAALGSAIENGFKLYVAEQGGKLGGREIDHVNVDDESDPSKATDNINKLIKRDNGAGSLTDGTLDAQGAAAEGLTTTLHYADSLNTPHDNAFRLAYAKTYKSQPDVYAVQGYEAAQILGIGLAATKGDPNKKDEFAAAVENAKIDSPRGLFTISKAHNPVQDFYLRQVQGKENKVVGIASKALTDPARGCRS